MIEIKNVYKSFKGKSVLVNVSLDIPTGEFLVLIGSSGCGKTTLLKMINKLGSLDGGEVCIDGKEIRQMKDTTLRRAIGYVVQDGGLFPHMTVAENVGEVLRVMGVDEVQRNRRIDELLDMVELSPADYRDLYPSQLSGGQRQRVGVARAFSTNPDIVLMDEPFSALDPVTRSELQDEIFRLQKEYGKTVVFVTHDMDEAIKLATRICIIQNGHIVQCDTPENILKKPVNSYVEEFIGKNKLWGNPEFIKASDIMKRNPCRISYDRTVLQAMQVIKHNAVDSVLVTKGRELVGIIRLADLNNIKDYTMPLSECISEDFVSVYEDTTLMKIICSIDYTMSGIIPVVSHENELLGFLTKSSLLATLSRRYTDGEEQHETEGVI